MDGVELDFREDRTIVDPVEDPAPRRCAVCGQALARRNQRAHPGRCARAHKTALQARRRRRARR